MRVVIVPKQSLIRRSLAVVAFIALVALSAFAQRRERVVDTWKPLHYDVDLNFNDQLTEFTSARTVITLQVLAPTLNKIDLDFGDLPIDSVLVASKPARYERTSELLNVFLPQSAARGQKLDITITYHGHPKDGLVLAKDRDG